MDVHFKLERHGDYSTTIFKLTHELLTYISALLALFGWRIINLLLFNWRLLHGLIEVAFFINL
jgi:hypothetical protein